MALNPPEKRKKKSIEELVRRWKDNSISIFPNIILTEDKKGRMV